MGVQFANEGLSKLVKAINLTIDFRTPLDKDEPWPKLQRNLHGVEVYLKIENGKGKQCVARHCDLEGKYHVFDKGEYCCEEHYMQRMPLLYATCAICFQYAELRTRTFFQNPGLETIYPDGKLQDGKQIRLDWAAMQQFNQIQQPGCGPYAYCGHRNC